MKKLSLPVSRLVKENISILLTFAFSRQPLEALFQKFHGDWKQLQETMFFMSEQRTEKACLELAIFLRYLDDEEGLATYVDKNTNYKFGRLIYLDGAEEELNLSDVANKIIHASGFSWGFDDSNSPMLICNSREEEKWTRAEISLVHLASVCGNLAG
jgi:hypothetical protein